MLEILIIELLWEVPKILMKLHIMPKRSEKCCSMYLEYFEFFLQARISKVCYLVTGLFVYITENISYKGNTKSNYW